MVPRAWAAQCTPPVCNERDHLLLVLQNLRNVMTCCIPHLCLNLCLHPSSVSAPAAAIHYVQAYTHAYLGSGVAPVEVAAEKCVFNAFRCPARDKHAQHAPLVAARRLSSTYNHALEQVTPSLLYKYTRNAGVTGTRGGASGECECRFRGGRVPCCSSAQSGHPCGRGVRSDRLALRSTAPTRGARGSASKRRWHANASARALALPLGRHPGRTSHSVREP